MRIFLNGKLVPLSRAVISVSDHGFLYGDGVFETFRAYSGVIFRLHQHLSRLEQSARLIHLKLPYSRIRLRDHLYRTLAANRLKDATLRMTVSRGVGELGLDPDLCARPTLVITARAFKGYPDTLYGQGMTAVVVSVRHIGSDSLDPRIKSNNFLSNVLAKIEAKKAGADEGLMLNPKGYLTEGTVSNIFIVRKNRLYTPSPRAGLLEGITRRVVLELAERMGLPTHQGLLTPEDLYESDECFLTNTSMEIMPVRKIGKVRIGRGKPGPVTQALRKAFRILVRVECEGRIKRRQVL
jgi:branched-chain amino acid aminotransferase